MDRLASLTAQLRQHQDLDSAQVQAAAAALAAAEVGDDAKAEFLTAFSDKGESTAEVAALARAFRDLAINPGVERWSANAIDVVGTGGDHSGGFNISSLVVLTLASAGVTAMKHGNRGITSQTGSADLMSALGVNLQASPEKMRQALDQLGYVFFFAPAFHPAFKHIAPVRKKLAAAGRRSVFNILGPLINPGRPAQVLLGAFAEAWVPKLAGAHELLGTKAGLAVHGRIGDGRGIDELTTATVNRVRGWGRMASVDGEWQANDFGLTASPFSELQGGDLAANLAIVDAVLAGRGPRGLVDSIVLNAAVGLWLTGKTADIESGLDVAREKLVGGAVKAKIDATREFYRSE